MSDFCDKLKSLRISAGYTQQSLADMLGVSSSSIGMYEQGRREPDRELLLKICSVFGVSLDYLLGNEEASSREVEDILDSIRTRMKSTDGLMFKGRPVDKEDIEKLYDAMLIAANVMLNNKKDSAEERNER